MFTRTTLVLAVLVALSPAWLRADVKTQERTQLRLEGALGRMVNMFGGRGAREGVVSSVALKGSRLLTMTGSDTGEIIDLAEEKVYTLNLKDKSYTVVTFAEMRKRMQEAMAKAEKDAAAAKPETETSPSGEAKKQYEVDFSIKAGAGARQIAGRDTKESIATIVVREKGKTLEEAGGMVLESHLWMAPTVPELKELADFRLKYAQQIYGPLISQSAPQMTQAVAMYPQMKDAMAKMAEEGRKLEGTPLLTEMVFQLAAPPGQATQSEQRSTPPPTGVGGLLGGLMRKKGGSDATAPAGGATPTAPGRTPIMTTTIETLQLTPAATDADVALPAGLKLKQ
jgi:hypothetical protein